MRKVEIVDLNAWFRSNHVLHDVSLTARPGSVTAIIGPSGCGKSTLIRCLNRMHEEVRGARVEGKVLFDGTDIYGTDVDPVAVRRRIGMVFQRPNPFPTMSILDNATAGLRLSGERIPRAKMSEQGERALQAAGLWDEVKDRLDEPGGRLSGGQQQRLCIARAIATKPDVILMDEPCSSLDPIATSKIEDLMQELVSDYTIVIVTHNMQQAARTSDRTAFFTVDIEEDGARTGTIVEYADTETLFTNPSDERTEAYVTGRFG